MADRITSIGPGTTHDEDVTINSSGGSDPDWTCVLNAVSGAVVGDLLLDEGGNEYLIVSGTGTVNLTLFDLNGIGSAPDTTTGGQAEIYRCYSSITAWEADWDDTTLYGTGFKEAVGKLYNDAVFDEGATVVFNGGGTSSLTSATLEPASGEGHDGTAGTGVRWDNTTDNLIRFFNLQPTSGINDSLHINGIELDGNDKADLRWPVSTASAAFGRVPQLHGLMLHNFTTSEANARVIDSTQRDVTVSNCIVYALATTSGRNFDGIHVDGDRAESEGVVHNTVQGLSGVAGTGKGIDVATDDATDGYLRNNLSDTQSNADYEAPGTGLDWDYNVSVDTSGDDGHASPPGNNVISVTSGDLFVLTTAGSENLHLQDASSPAHDVAEDLGDVVHKTDAAGVDRNADHSGAWDAGALQLVASSDTAMAASLTCSASVTADLDAQITMAASLTASATLAADLHAQIAMAAALNASATLAADLDASVKMAAALATSATLTADLDAQITMAAALSTTVTLAVDLDAQITMATSLTGTATVTALLDAGALKASLACTATVGADLDAQIPMAAALVTSATLAADLDAQVTMAAGLTVTAVLAAELSSGKDIATALAISATLAADLNAQVTMASSVTLSATLAAELDARVTMAAAFSLSATLTADIITGIQPKDLDLSDISISQATLDAISLSEGDIDGISFTDA